MILQILVAVASVMALFALAALIRKLSGRFVIGAESQRKAVHVGVGLHAMVLPLILHREGFLVFAVLAAAALLVLRLPGIAAKGLGASLHSVERQSWGDFLFLIAITVLFVLSPGDPALYVLPIAVLTLSDAAAALVGTSYGRLRFGEGDRVKSAEGSIAFFVVTWMTVVIILLSATEIPRQNVIWLATMVSLFATYVEADSWRGLDNLFVPVGIHILLVIWAESPPLILGAITTGWLIVLLAARYAAPLVGMTPHAARAASVALILSVIVANPINAILPVLAFFAALVARPAAEGVDAVLDYVSTLVLTGMIWIITGTVFGTNAIAYYSATFAAIGAGYAAFAMRQSRFRIPAGVAAAILATGIYWLLFPAVIRHMGWVPALPLGAVVAAATLLTVMTETLRPKTWGERGPGLRFAATALLLLLPAYFHEAL
ncbi:hypothetical protein [Roseibium sp. MMSF_3544]|uniref:hypothetical protein n=1 Tax=unclassified Roseibium TaxID=2629323 RepID=UPI00273F31CA|nr:hypothetical protein [Roseibium sp. MMSF_3544]